MDATPTRILTITCQASPVTPATLPVRGEGRQPYRRFYLSAVPDDRLTPYELAGLLTYYLCDGYGLTVRDVQRLSGRRRRQCLNILLALEHKLPLLVDPDPPPDSDDRLGRPGPPLTVWYMDPLALPASAHRHLPPSSLNDIGCPFCGADR